MQIDYSDHALKRMKERGITQLQVEHILDYPSIMRKSFEGRKEIIGIIENRTIKIIIIKTESYINIITII